MFAVVVIKSRRHPDDQLYELV